MGTVVRSSVDLGASQTLAVNVATKKILPTFTLDGAPFPASQYERGDFLLRDATGDGLVSIGDSSVPPSPIVVIKGSYHVLYEHRSGGTTVPVNERARITSVDVD